MTAVIICSDFGAQEEVLTSAAHILKLEPKKRKSVTTSTFSPSIYHRVMEPDAVTFAFLIFNLEPALSLSSFTLI